MADPHLNVFISATSRDLQSSREVVKSALLTGGVFPVVQEHFPPDHRELTQFLKDRIERCDAVICLVGFVHGAAPNGPGTRSYTQIEYDVARELAKPVFVFLAMEETHIDESEHKREMQRQHRAGLLRDHKCTLFSSAEQLRLAVAELIPWLPRPWGGTAVLPFLYLHPPREPARFVGRQTELKQLAEAVRPTAPCLIAVIGLGGQGKTTLVAQWLPWRTGPTPWQIGPTLSRTRGAVLTCCPTSTARVGSWPGWSRAGARTCASSCCRFNHGRPKLSRS